MIWICIYSSAFTLFPHVGHDLFPSMGFQYIQSMGCWGTYYHGREHAGINWRSLLVKSRHPDPPAPLKGGCERHLMTPIR